MMMCAACGRRVFTPSVDTCPDCGAALKNIRASEPAYARDLGADPGQPKPPASAPRGEVLPGGDLVPARMQAVPIGWIRKALLVLLAFVACFGVGSRLLQADDPGRRLEAQVSAEQEAKREAERARCEKLCPNGERHETRTVASPEEVPPGGETTRTIADDEGCGPCRVTTSYEFRIRKNITGWPDQRTDDGS